MKKSVCVLLFLGIGLLTVSWAQEKKAKKVFRIGVTQIVSHPALDKAAKGFELALAEAGFKEGEHIVYDRQNAQGEMSNAQAIAQKFLNAGMDLIHSIATPTSQAAVKTIRTIPIVFSAVTDPVDAGLVPRSSRPGTGSGTNVTGVSDRWPIQLQLEMYTRFVPRAKKWGTIYSAGEANSLVLIKEMREAAKKLGLELVEGSVANTAEVLQAAQSLAGKVQAFNITSDNTAVSAIEAIVKVGNEKKIPVFAGDVDSAARGAVAAYGLDYFLHGYSAGQKAARILKGEKAGDVPWGLGERFYLVINQKAAKAQGVVVPADLLKRADRVIRE